MATYAIGDVQGCQDELERLLGQCGFEAARDRLWFVGDLVNRGPKSLEVVRFVRGLGSRAVTVLGNHDLHLLCVAEGVVSPRADDTLGALLGAPDAAELLGWLRRQPLLHVEQGYAMVHAGLLPQWTIERAGALAREAEAALAGPACREFLRHLYGGEPARWDDALAGWDRLRVIVNVMTRMRFCSPDGGLALGAKGAAPPPGLLAWFDARPARAEPVLVCGHWSQLGLKLSERVLALDSGCVWGGALTALRLEDRRLYQVPCPGYQPVGAE